MHLKYGHMQGFHWGPGTGQIDRLWGRLCPVALLTSHPKEQNKSYFPVFFMSSKKLYLNLENVDSLRRVIDLLSSFAKRNHGKKWNCSTMHCESKCSAWKPTWHFQNHEKIHVFAMVTGKRMRLTAQYFPARPDLPLLRKGHQEVSTILCNLTLFVSLC